jgi:hypothetical protein
MSEHAVNDQRGPIPFEERRKGQRRDGVGRRINGDRRVPLEPGSHENAGRARGKERRVFKRRVLPDRRAG